jgi:hypothetical protein
MVVPTVPSAPHFMRPRLRAARCPFAGDLRWRALKPARSRAQAAVPSPPIRALVVAFGVSGEPTPSMRIAMLSVFSSGRAQPIETGGSHRQPKHEHHGHCLSDAEAKGAIPAMRAPYGYWRPAKAAGRHRHASGGCQEDWDGHGYQANARTRQPWRVVGRQWRGQVQVAGLSRVDRDRRAVRANLTHANECVGTCAHIEVVDYWPMSPACEDAPQCGPAQSQP